MKNCLDIGVHYRLSERRPA